MRFTLKDGGLFAFAGLEDGLADEDGWREQSVAILTTAPNPNFPGPERSDRA